MAPKVTYYLNPFANFLGVPVSHHDGAKHATHVASDILLQE